MTDAHPDNIKKRQTVNDAAFVQFLGFLSPDAEEAGRHYTRLHKKLAGFFSLRGISDPVSAADETIDRAIIKINAGIPVPDPGKYCLGIARNIVKERLRHTRRETIAFNRFIEDINNSSSHEVERINQILKPCFDELIVEDQKLLTAYCQVIRGRERAEHRRQLAEAMRTTVLALRMRVTRLRREMADCVRTRLDAN